jgi:hypothetical protein
LFRVQDRGRRDRALFEVAVDSKLRGRFIVLIKNDEVGSAGRIRQ